MSIHKDVIDLLKKTLSEKPNIQQLQLDFMHINDLLPYMDYLSKLKYLKSLSLYGNRLRQLPIDMSSLQGLEYLDISNNLLNDVDMVTVSLKTLPRLRTLKYPVKKEKQTILIQNLHNLTLLNDLHIIRQAGKKPMPLMYMTEEGLGEFKKQIMQQYQKIKGMEETYLDQKKGQREQQQQDYKFVMEVDQIIKNSLKKIAQKEGDLTQTLQDIYFIKTKYQIFELIRARCVNIGMDYYGELGKLIKQVLDVQHKLFESLIYESLKLVKFEYQIRQIELEKREKNNMNIENKILVKNEQLEKEIKRIKKQKDELLIEINQLQSENKRYLQSLVRFAKGDKSGLINASMGPQTHFSKESHSQSFSHNFVPSQIIKPQKPNKTVNITKESLASNYFSNGRNLTLKQLKETIQEIYQGKLKFDKKNSDGKLPRQTMHQYLFTHLNQKYGLKNLTIEAAGSIVGGIQTYSSQDNDVAVFGKILRNEIDQNFRNTQKQIKITIYDLIKLMINNQNLLKSAAEKEQLFKQKINGEIQNDQIEEIVKYLYNKTDSDRLLRKIELLYRLSKSNRPIKSSKTAKTKEEQATRRLVREQHNFHEKQKKKLEFQVFLKTVLDFQLRIREKDVRPLLNVFKARDTDCDGIVNEDQFIKIIEDLTEQARDLIPEMLMIVDPYETKSITYSQMVNLLMNYPEKNPILSRFMDNENEIQDLQ